MDIKCIQTYTQFSRLRRLLTNLFVQFKSRRQLPFGKCLYKFLQCTKHHDIPKFYGLPKVHKIFVHLPPMTPVTKPRCAESCARTLCFHSAKSLDFNDHDLVPAAEWTGQEETALVEFLSKKPNGGFSNQYRIM